jgi:arylsulfatase
MTTTQPNILFLFPDQLRHDALGCAGNPIVSTPHLDRIAASGLRFSQAWCQSPICQPSRASLITGRYPTELGIVSNVGGLPGLEKTPGAPRIDPQWPTVMKTLKAAGYETASIGKTHYHDLPDPGEVEAAGGNVDLRMYDELVSQFGWDYVVEEYDKYTHAVDGLTTPYTEYLHKEGMLDAYAKQIRGIFRTTPTHWRAETSCLDKEHDLTTFLADHATRWLQSRRTDAPFFLKLAFVQPHVPLVGDPSWAKFYADTDIPVPPHSPISTDVDAWRAYLDTLNEHSQVQAMSNASIVAGTRQYYAMVSLIDEAVGGILATLEQLGQLDNTWVVLASDHGEMLGDHGLWAKMNFYHGSVQTPLIIRPPGGLKHGRESQDLVELVDLTATLAAIGGAEVPTGCRGRSLLPALSDESVGRAQLNSYIRTFSALRDERYRFTYDLKSEAACELFDLVDDPDEQRNLIDDPSMSDVVEHYIGATRDTASALQ